MSGGQSVMLRHGDPTRILHVDDDDDIRELVKFALEMQGSFQVTQFASGVETLENVDRIDADLFLLDVMMPGLSGSDTLAKLRTFPRFSMIPAVFLTAKAAPKELEHLKVPGVAAVIAKPFDPVVLPQTLTEVLESFVPG